GGYQGIGFAIPTNMARPIMNSLISTGKVVRGWLGVTIQDVTRELKEALGLSTDRGVLIGDVVDGSPAARAGLRRGDVVVKIGTRATPRSSDLRNAIASAGAGKRVELEVVRGGKRQTVPVVLGEMPADEGRVAGGGSRGGGDRGTPAADLGVRVAPLSRANRQRYDIGRDVTHGVVVTGVSPDSVAAEIGLREGDVILQVNRTAIKSARQLEQAYRKAGKKVALLIHRGGGTVYVVVTK
ncbi:MAG TPA: PDZ domain-containing protein, partial [Kofleriaceae bacterium]|nr:PDZ domain-containing protein [Kofleriaceae bacterium]